MYILEEFFSTVSLTVCYVYGVPALNQFIAKTPLSLGFSIPPIPRHSSCTLAHSQTTHIRLKFS
ncbi:hypothetical protein K435DRAFT_180964 [Dendrothele bispora CBS 962.96]|uniref:Uncharacterized protein n=1 Tax=Dendrothele bispora (strain CBS 962.96) TaxID=1314807 RepID=A0A4S8LXJ2_DENBC|nr:hypothetical protein K435DRAFT_180964 [Dendrothele bispora CBS 962.96]